MTKIQNTVLNYITIAIALFSYAVLKTYNDFQYLQIIQKIFIFLIFFSGLGMLINNFLYFKQANKKYITVALICLGIVLVIYSGIALYLISALQNAGF